MDIVVEGYFLRDVYELVVEVNAKKDYQGQWVERYFFSEPSYILN